MQTYDKDCGGLFKLYSQCLEVGSAIEFILCLHFTKKSINSKPNLKELIDNNKL